jgi:hypothetical protein
LVTLKAGPEPTRSGEWWPKRATGVAARCATAWCSQLAFPVAPPAASYLAVTTDLAGTDQRTIVGLGCEGIVIRCQYDRTVAR